jgi:hypothetical protein
MAPLQVSAAGGGLASIDDVALAVMMLQLEGMDADIAGRIKKMQALNEVRKAYGDRIAEYRKITMGKTGKEALDVPEELRHRVDYAPDNETGRSVTVESEEFIDNDGDGRAWASTIQAEMDRLQGELDKLGGDAEIEMMLINRAVKQRESVLSFTTNVLSSSHQARMAIIGNIGK